MKKLFFLSRFVFGLAIINVNAQTATEVSNENTTAAVDEAAKAAAADENIVAKVCPHSGTTTYYQKSVCEKTGNVKMTKVVFDANSGSFVAAEAAGKSCAGDKAGAKGCSKGGAKSCSKGGDKKACCKGGAKKGACCKGGAKKGCAKSNSKTK